MEHGGHLYTLIPLADFKAVLDVDDRDDALSRYCLTTAAYTIEHCCKRRLVRKKHTDYFTFTGEPVFTLREYPVRRITAVWTARAGSAGSRFSSENLIDPQYYYCLPDTGICEDIPFSLVLRPLPRLTEGAGIKVRYAAGYVPGEAPADLASACLELAAWNMSRYRGRRIGVTGNVRGSGKDGEHLESSMPENVRMLLEPYMRRVI
jgi:uncharacterized phiE125 gp8 family phage protein